MFNPKENLLDQQLSESGLEMNFFLDFLTGGADSRNKAATAQVKNQRANIRANYEFQWGDSDSDELGGEALRKYDYAQEGLMITKRNTEANLAFQEAERMQQYHYGMGIRAYEHNQEVKAYNAAVSGALQQQSFNQLAEQAALVDQERLLHEQMLSIAFDETETLLNYGAATVGLGLKKRQAKAQAVTRAQADRISTLKETGAAMARGASGRTAGKNIQGLLAESGARQAAIIDEFMFNTEATEQDFMRLNRQFIIDQVGFETSRESATLSDVAAKNRIKLQSLQAAMDAASRIPMVPELSPPLPKPYALPRPEFQDIYEPKKPPMTQVADAAQENLFAAGLNTTIGLVAQGAGIYRNIKGPT